VKHIFREYNSVADNLSKQALNLAEDKLFIVEFHNDVKLRTLKWISSKFGGFSFGSLFKQKGCINYL